MFVSICPLAIAGRIIFFCLQKILCWLACGRLPLSGRFFLNQAVEDIQVINMATRGGDESGTSTLELHNITIKVNVSSVGSFD